MIAIPSYPPIWLPEHLRPRRRRTWRTALDRLRGWLREPFKMPYQGICCGPVYCTFADVPNPDLTISGGCTTGTQCRCAGAFFLAHFFSFPNSEVCEWDFDNLSLNSEVRLLFHSGEAPYARGWEVCIIRNGDVTYGTYKNALRWGTSPMFPESALTTPGDVPTGVLDMTPFSNGVSSGENCDLCPSVFLAFGGA